MFPNTQEEQLVKHTAIALVALGTILAACSADDGAATTTSDGPAATAQTSTTAVVRSTDTPPASSESTTTTTSEAQSDPEPVAVNIGPVDATPAQQEGPYYPVEKLNDQDNDLTVVDGSGDVANGQVLLLEGLLVTTAGDSIEGATIEIWQTDDQGIYLHPGDPSTDGRDRSFQFYGETVTPADGSWSFLTILPGEYEPRPRHIHAKVVVDGEVVLTTQIYFSDDSSGEDPRLIAEVEPGTDDNGEPVLTASHVIALDR